MTALCPKVCGTCRSDDPPGYRRSPDYIPRVLRELVGTAVVPHIFGAFLVATPTLAHVLSTAAAASDPTPAGSFYQSDVRFLHWLSAARVVAHVTNVLFFGYLVDPTGYNAGKKHPALFLVEKNPDAFGALYLHRDYARFREPEVHHKHSCGSDAYRLPLVNKRFCDELIGEAEFFGGWSGGGKKDTRLKGGYENVPTVDIHFNQMGYEGPWYHVLRQFIKPVVEHHYTGYTMDGRNTLAFIVKYTPHGQSFLRPHFDASTVTFNMALNTQGLDFEGGGTRFVRQNCTVLEVEPGEGVLFPGHLTHYHEGLPTTQGTRYISVSFIDQ
jgi:hypothetical protein